MSLSTLNAAESTASSSSTSNTSHDSTTSPFKSSLAPALHPSTPTRSSNPSSSACSSAHPSPNGTPMDAMTPRSLKQYDASDLGSAALGALSSSSPPLAHEPADSPFFAGWERDCRTHGDSGSSPRGHTSDLTSSPEQKRYSLSSSLATSSTTPLYASATSPLFVAPASPPNSSNLLPSLPQLQVLVTPSITPQGWSSPMSPLPIDAIAPSAPKLGMLPTPVMSPRSSLPTTPLASYLRSLSPLQRAEVAGSGGPSESCSPNIKSLLDVQGKLPLPGSLEDEDVTISPAMLSQAMRSDSANSISSVLNDTGHDTSPPLESPYPAPHTLYNGSAFIHDINAPPLQAIPMPVAVERALPVLPTKQHASDPPLIPSLRRPDLMHLAGETSTSPRPISPFSPTLPLFSEASRSHISTEFDNTRPDIPDTERDLINFDSDSDSALPEMYDQYAHYQDIQGDSVYLARNNYSTQSFRQQEERASASISSSDEDEEGEDYSNHALYNTLSTSESPYVRRAWEGSRVVLVPSKHTLPHSFLSNSKQWNANTSHEKPEIWERFAAIHALRQETGSPDYIGFGETSDGFRLHARLDSENRQVQISLRQELDSSSLPSHENTLNEFGMAQQPTSQLLSRHTFSSSTASDQSSTIPPHLLVSSPATSVESGNFPDTPPLSSTMSPSVPSRISSGSGSASGSTPRIPQSVAFPSIEQAANSYVKTPLSPTRRLNIVHEKVIYRKRRLRSTVSNSAPSTLPSPPPTMSRIDSTMSNASAAAAVQVNSIQQATDRLSKLSTPSMQSISSLASISTSNGKTVKRKDSKVRLRVPKWLGGRNRDSISGLKITESAPATPIQPQMEPKQAAFKEEVQLVIEKVRLIQVDSYIVEWPGEATITSPTRDYRRSSSLSAKQSQQNLTVRMHRKLSQPLSASSLSLQDATVKERRSFQHPPFSATLVEEPADIPGIASVRMGSRHDSNASHSSRASKRSSNAQRMKHTSQASSTPGAIRDFSSDIAYLLDPPKYLEHFSGLFEQSLKMIIRSSKDLAERFYYIRTQEQEAVERLRTEVLDQVWQYFADEEAIHGLRHHLLDIFENAIMAFAHDYVYSKTISPSFSHQEADFGNLINTYRIHTIQIADFGISSGHYSEPAFAPVVDILSELCGSGARRQELWEKMPPQSYKRLVQLISQTTDSATTVIALLEARTPLDTIAHLRKAIDELVKATSASDSGHEESYSRLATDDLIPLLSWALVKANAKTLPSLLFYAKMFRLSAHTQADSEWTIVQFEAAMAYLSTDPLRLQRKSASMSSPMESQSVSPVQPMFLRTVSEDSLGPTRRSRRSSVQSLPPESARTVSRSPSQQTHLASYHKRTLSSLPSTRMALYQAAGRPSSIVSAVTTEEDEDNAEMGPPAPPRKDSVCGSADSHDLLSVSTSATGRERSTSPPIHRPVAVRPPRRPFHLSHDQMQGTSQNTRIPLARSQTTPLNNTIRPPSFPNQRTSAELSRTGSDTSRRGSGDWWGPLRQAIAPGPASPPVGNEGTQSSLPDSPASPAVKSIERYSSARSSFDLERSTSDMGWVEWGRKRLSSMTSSTSLVESAEGGRSVAEQIAEKLAASAVRSGGVPTANRNRRNSESAASMLSPTQFEQAASEIQAIAAPSIAEPSPMTSFNARSLSSARNRPRSTLSLSSTSSLDTDASLSRSTNTTSAPLAARSQFRNSIAGTTSGYAAHSSNLSRSRRFRKELRSANLAPSMALPQLQLDTASASASNSSSNTGSSSFIYSHRSISSMHSDTGSGSSFGNQGFYHSHSLSHSTSRLGTTPFSPIQEVTPSLQAYPSSPEQILGIKNSSNNADSDESVPPTPRDYLSAHRPWSQPTLSS